MTDRGQQPVDVSPACPFVAFDDERDVRSTVPDHRHRCYAELRPAPRAIAHQQAYCLSANFASCPTFADWARREAARARPGAEGDRAAEPVGGAAAGLAASGRARGPSDGDAGWRDDADAAEVWPRRSEREWAAPPPWVSDHGAPPPDEDAAVAAPSFLASRAGRREPAPQSAGRESAGPEGPGPGPGRGEGPGSRSDAAGWPELPDEGEAEEVEGDDDFVEEERSMRRFGPRPGRGGPPPRGSQVRRRAVPEAGGPAWERPRRFEAYPTLRTRTGLPALPPIVLGLGAIVILALALFFIPPFLLGLGGGSSSASPTPSPSATAASASAAPSSSPAAATPLLYVVKAGDTMSKIAAQFNVPLDQLISANRATVKDPNKVQIGDQLVIPTPVPQEIPGATSPSPSP